MLTKIFGVNWKSSVSGLLTFALVTLGAVSAWLASLPATSHIAAWVTSGIGLLTGLAKVWLSFVTVDAGTTLAKVPGIAEPQPVDSHETPDNPKAKPVV